MGEFTNNAPLKLWRVDEPITARHLNEVIMAFNQLLTGNAGPRQLVRANVPAVRQFKVITEMEDYVTCNAFDGVDSGDLVYNVAKPYLLRRTPFDGETRKSITYTYSSNYQRTADDGVDTESQIIVPSYTAGDIIYAVMGIAGSTSVWQDTSSAEPGRNKIFWVDLNVDGRCWAKVSA